MAYIIRQRVELMAQQGVMMLQTPLQYGDANAHEWQLDVVKKYYEEGAIHEIK